MPQLILFLLLLVAIPHAVSVWWRMRRARSTKERAFHFRTGVGGYALVVVCTLAFLFVGLRGQLIALPVAVAAVIIYRYAVGKARERLMAEESDPVARAKRIN